MNSKLLCANRRQARENAREHETIGYGLSAHWLKRGADDLLSMSQLKTVQYHCITDQIFSLSVIGKNVSRDPIWPSTDTGKCITGAKYINNSLHLARKYAQIFVRGRYLFREANSFPRAKLEENCELRGADNVQAQISEHIF